MVLLLSHFGHLPALHILPGSIFLPRQIIPNTTQFRSSHGCFPAPLSQVLSKLPNPSPSTDVLNEPKQNGVVSCHYKVPIAPFQHHHQTLKIIHQTSSTLPYYFIVIKVRQAYQISAQLVSGKWFFPCKICKLAYKSKV